MRLTEAFHWQAKACRSMGSPFMGQLMELCATRLTPGTPLTDRMHNWPGDLSPRAESLPLRFAGALHALRLAGNTALASVYPPDTPSDDALWQAVETALATESAFISRFLDLPPQTNEVRRSVALIAGAHVAAAHFPGLPFRLSELGASAGLNLNWDQFALDIGQAFGPKAPALTLRPEWTGPLPPLGRPEIIERRGVDLNPVTDPARIRAYLWPDQPERMTLTDAALQLPRPPVDKGDAIDWLKDRLTPTPGQLHLIQNTVAWQYFPKDRQTEGRALIEAAGALATAEAPLAWLSLEADDAPRGAAITLRLWPGDLTLDLGRGDFHGRWIEWSPA